MSQVRVYINTFDEGGDYTSFQDVTSDVDARSIPSITQKLGNNDYDVGLYRNSNLSLFFRNDHGKFSEVGVFQSIFVNKRIDSLVKVTWQLGSEAPICGVAICGEAQLGPEVNIFYGLLNDTTSTQNIKDQRIKFSIQGLESIFDRVETNFSSLSVSDNISTTIYKLLNQTSITSLMTVDQANISVDIDQVPDNLTDLEETTVREALELLLEAGNAVLYVSVEDQTVYVKPRTASASVDLTLYGQASSNGIENILDINNIRTGLNRTFNFLKWEDTTLVAKDETSVQQNGVRKKEIDLSIITDTTKRTNILESYRDEFSTPKQELTVSTYFTYESINSFLLDRVVVDYPTVFESAPESNLPIYGAAVYGQDRYPLGQWSLTIPTTKNFKILGRKVNLKNETITYELREI